MKEVGNKGTDLFNLKIQYMSTTKNRPHNILEIINLASSARNFIGGQFVYLREHGYEMHLICSPDDEMEEYARFNHVKYHPILLSRTLSPWADFKAFIEICKYIHNNRIDTVIAHQAKARLLGTTAAWMLRVPNRIIFAHGVIFETMKGLKRKLVILMDRMVATMSHKTVCVSRSVANARLLNNVEKSSRQYLLGVGTCGGIDTQNLFNPVRIVQTEQDELKRSLGISDNDFVIGFCGRMVQDKGIRELVDAFKLIKQERSNDHNIKLLLIGPVEVRDSISQELVDFIKTGEDIINCGSVNHDDIYKYFSLFSVVVLPSYREGFGMVTIECAAMNIPAIVSKSTGCIDSIVENETGVYCEINTKSIADKINFMIDHEEKRKEMGEKARRLTVELYDNKVVWPHIIKVIEA